MGWTKKALTAAPGTTLKGHPRLRAPQGLAEPSGGNASQPNLPSRSV